MDYCILLRKVQFFGFHGLYPEEAVRGNQFEVDLKVFYSRDQPIEKIDQTVDYVTLYELIREQMQVRRLLLETLGNEICFNIKNKFPQVRAIELEIRKINPPIQGFEGQVGICCSVKYQ